jgi:hypothetical protein
MSWLSTGLQLVGLGADLYSSYKNSDAAEEQGELQAEEYRATAAANAEISRYDANVERLMAIEQSYVGNQTVATHRRKLETFVGTQKARFSKSGVYTEGGSPLDVAASTIKDGLADEYTIRNEGRKASQTHALLAERYEMLATKGLREGASYAAMASQAGDDASSAYMISGIGSAASKAYNIAADYGWLDK